MAISAANLILSTPPWTYSVQTNPAGEFTQEVISGTYKLVAAAPGYAPTTLENVIARSGVTTTVQIRLSVQAPLSNTLYYLPLILNNDE